MLKKISLLFCFVIFVLLIYTFAYLKPTNNKIWVSGMQKQPNITINGNIVEVKNFRQWRYKNKETVSFNYSTKQFDINEIKNVYFYVEPFSDFKAIAHSYLVFNFNNNDTVAISIEARREKNEDYSAFLGLFNKYEIIYLWGDDLDITGRSTIIEKNIVEKHILKISNKQAGQIFLQLARDTQKLQTHPQFYNTVTNSCTIALAQSINRAYPNTLPIHISWFFYLA